MDDADRSDGTGHPVSGADSEAAKRRAAVRPHESDPDRPGERPEADRPGAAPDSGRARPAPDADRAGPPGRRASGDDWIPDDVDPDDVPSYFVPVSVEDPDLPRAVDVLGSIGVFVVAIALVLSIVGIGAAYLGIQPLGNVAITFSLGLGAVAMLFGLVYQAFASDMLSRSG